MEKRTCVSCSKVFTITDREILYYRSRNLELPKRCEACRKTRKALKDKKNKKHSSAAFSFFCLTAVILLGLGVYMLKAGYAYNSAIPAGAGTVILLLCILTKTSRKKRVTSQLKSASQKYEYSFRSEKDFSEHFEKHGHEVGAKTPDEYLKKANAVIHSSKSLKKHEKEDNDLIYFYPATGEIVFLSDYGKIRSYYISDLDYFNRQ